ncbi:ABC transporter ATP-binding protein [Laedolimicola intestinihominis]|uniref:ABC transporter ATP-binding protein n=1 Tax=Laedolimicola intestinihominis TaxID=3133166 RepID=A0ABV1FHD2_9FIRM
MIEVKDLVKRYSKNTAVDHLNFHVQKGQIYGFLGPNGAGKSTTMNMMTGYLAPTEGQILINGYDVAEEPMEARKCIGYLPEIPPLYPDMTVLEYLRFAAELKQLPKNERSTEIERVMDETRIKDMENRLIRHLSKGYKQRVGLAQALLGDPEVLILDEPMVGLDPKQIIEIRELIRGLGQKHTVILSSHILSEISSICDHVLIISNGKLVASDTPENLGSYMKHTDAMELQVRGSKEVCEQAIELLKQVKGLEVKTTTATLEDVFLELTNEENNGNPKTTEEQEKTERFSLRKKLRKTEEKEFSVKETKSDEKEEK